MRALRRKPFARLCPKWGRPLESNIPWAGGARSGPYYESAPVSRPEQTSSSAPKLGFRKADSESGPLAGPSTPWPTSSAAPRRCLHHGRRSIAKQLNVCAQPPHPRSSAHGPSGPAGNDFDRWSLPPFVPHLSPPSREERGTQHGT